jgi:type IV pilus assembly protein PilM
MLDFLKLKTEAFGLDISDLSLKIIKLKKTKRGLELASFGKKEIKPGIIKDGKIIREEELTETIKGAFKEIGGQKLKTKYVIASLPEEKAFFQVIQMPKVAKEDLRSAVIFEAENYIPMPIEKVYLDFQTIIPIKDHLDHLDVLVAAIPKDDVDPYLSSLKKAGLEPKTLEVESLAISRALIKDETTNSSVLLIDFGATRTSFIIFSGRSLRFTSSISVSSVNFTEIISKSLGIDLVKAEKLKIKYGLEEKIKQKSRSKEKEEIKKERSRIFESLVPAIVDLTQQIKKHLHYYQTHDFHEHLPSKNNSVSKILLCGGGSTLNGLAELLSSELKLPVEIGNPWINILKEGKKETKQLSFNESQSYTTALGLAIRGVEENDN